MVDGLPGLFPGRVGLQGQCRDLADDRYGAGDPDALDLAELLQWPRDNRGIYAFRYGGVLHGGALSHVRGGEPYYVGYEQRCEAGEVQYLPHPPLQLHGLLLCEQPFLEADADNHVCPPLRRGARSLSSLGDVEPASLRLRVAFLA